MVNNFDYITRWLLDMKVKNFSVFEAGKTKDEAGRGNGNALKLNGDEPIQEKIQTFADWCDNNTGSFILVQQDGNSYNSELKFMLPFRALPPQPATATPVTIQGVTGVPAGYISEKELETKLENERLKMRLERMEEDLKSYKQQAQENSSSANDFFKTVTPFVGPVLQGLLGGKMKAAQIGSLDAAHTQEPEEVPEKEPEAAQDEDLDISEEDFKRLAEDLKRLKAADTDYLEIIHKLSFLTSDPMYSSAKQMILNR